MSGKLLNKARLKTTRLLAAFGMLMALSACGWAEWPPPGEGPGLAYGPGSDAFINATAVTVGRGDTVYAIARRHRVSPREVIEVNNLRPPYALNVGQRLKLPGGRIHVVKKGEYLSLIAKNYKSNAFSIARINGVAKPYTIYPGQKLRIPRDGGAPATGTVSARNSSSKTSGKTASVPVPVSQPPVMSGNGFLWPVKGKIISGFGPKAKGLQNDGINIAAPRGTPVRAAQNGVVAYAGNELRGFGNLLLVKHSNGWITAYAHNDSLLVKRGDKISKGQDIARIGSTGSVSTPQLHFELRKGRRAVDPKPYLKG